MSNSEIDNIDTILDFVTDASNFANNQVDPSNLFNSSNTSAFSNTHVQPKPVQPKPAQTTQPPKKKSNMSLYICICVFIIIILFLYYKYYK